MRFDAALSTKYRATAGISNVKISRIQNIALHNIERQNIDHTKYQGKKSNVKHRVAKYRRQDIEMSEYRAHIIEGAK